MCNDNIDSGNDEEECMKPENDSCEGCDEKDKCKTHKYPPSTKEEREKMPGKLEDKVWFDEIQETFK